MNKEVLDRMKTRLISKGGLNKELVGIVGKAESEEEIEEDFVDNQGSQKLEFKETIDEDAYVTLDDFECSTIDQTD